jgi:L-alanine-DL-glutamate epimerase-like enolase superfamily enzyme
MRNNRRNFLRNTFIGSLAATIPFSSSASVNTIHGPGILNPDYEKLDEALKKPVLSQEFLTTPVIIERLDLLRYKDSFLCKARSVDGVEGYSVGNNMQLVSLYPVFTHRLQQFFKGKDARDLEALLEEVYVHQSNYKLQGLALWIPLATIEFAILDLLGQMSGKAMGELIGEIHNPQVAVYQANGERDNSAEEVLENLKRQVQATQAKALKIKVGGRMSHTEFPEGRTERLIPMVRKEFGNEMVMYADSNGSYNVEEAIRIGKLLEEYKYDFYEEPVPFDWYEETKQVADALNIPIAGGEQEPSLRNFRWLIGNNALDIVQPDMFYFGGMIRSMKVARMAEAMGKECTPHISGSGLGFLYMMHFVSALPNAGPFHEFKEFNKELPFECPTSPLKSKDGIIKVPTGPGLGVEIDPDYIDLHQIVEA